MKGKKKIAKGLWKKIVASSLLSLVAGYLASNGLKSLYEKSPFKDNVLDFEGTIDYLSNADPQMLMIVLIAVGISFYLVLKNLGIYENGYQDASDFGLHGTSRFAKTEEIVNDKILSKQNTFYKDNIKSIKKLNDGIVLGKYEDTNKLYIIPDDTKINNNHTCVIGASGSGKGQAFVLNNLYLNKRESMIVTDPKGELYRDTQQMKRDQGYNVYQIDFIDFMGAGWNPLDYIDSDSDVLQITQTIAKNSAEDGKEDFFFMTAKDLFTGLMIYCKSMYGSEATIQHVKEEQRRIAKSKDYLYELCEEIGSDHPAYNYLEDAKSLEGKTKASVMGTFAQLTGIFNVQAVTKMTAKSDFNFYDFQKQKSILYVKMPMQNNQYKALTTTFFDQLIDVLYKIALSREDAKLPIKTRFILDEFANIGKIEKYPNVLSTARGLGISFATIIQDIAQLETIYGKEVARTILSNHSTHLFLATGDPDTSKYYSGMGGETTVFHKGSSTSKKGGWLGGGTSISSQDQYVKRPLITEGELSRIDKDVCYIFIQGQYPIKAKRAWQYQVFEGYVDNYSVIRKKLYDFEEERSEQGEIKRNLKYKDKKPSVKKQEYANVLSNENSTPIPSLKTVNSDGYQSDIKESNPFSSLSKGFLSSSRGAGQKSNASEPSEVRAVIDEGFNPSDVEELQALVATINSSPEKTISEIEYQNINENLGFLERTDEMVELIEGSDEDSDDDIFQKQLNSIETEGANV